MKIPTPIALLVIALALGVVAYIGYNSYLEKVGILVVDDIPPTAKKPEISYPPYLTEENWAVQQVGQFIADFSSLAHRGSLHKISSSEKVGSEGKTSFVLSGEGPDATLSLDPAVWSPATYTPWTRQLFGDLTTDPSSNPLPDLPQALLTPRLDVFLAQNAAVSKALQEHPTSISGHLNAALLLGTIGHNDYAGCFHDTRPILNRLTAHLAVADVLGANPAQPERQLAEAIRLTLCGNQVAALDLLSSLKDPVWQQPAYQSWISILKLRNTNDWRSMEVPATQGPLALQIEYFRALADAVGVPAAREFARKTSKDLLVDFCRIVNRDEPSVSDSHIFTSNWIPLEISESRDAAKFFGIPADKTGIGLRSYLDTVEGSPVLLDDEGKPFVQVAGRNLFASFHQRHLLESFNRTYSFFRDRWGALDDARQLKTFVDNLFVLRYTPFLHRMVARSPAEYNQANEECKPLIISQPQIITPDLWTYLNLDYRGKPFAYNTPDFHPWFNPIVPAGTAFEAGDRAAHLGLSRQEGEALMKQAPYCLPLASVMVGHNPTPEVVLQWMSPMVDYVFGALDWLSYSYRSQPDLYEKWMVKAAELNSNMYIVLADYFVEKNMPEKAAKYYLIAFDKTDDRVYMANSSSWIVSYLYNKGDTDMALKIAADAAEVYSEPGLRNYLNLLERMGRWDEAIATAKKLDERYADGIPRYVIECETRKSIIEAMQGKVVTSESFRAIFPDGLKKAGLGDFSGPPQRGILLVGESPKLHRFGLHSGDIVVGVNGYHVENVPQYNSLNGVSPGEHLKLIVWDGKSFSEHEGDLPGLRFGIEIRNYQSK